ncbi:MAG: ATP-binding cassette domain-containing protein, partial [Candidatus Mariimomonas ferrooxydans]
MNALSVENLCVKVNDCHLVENITFSVEKGSTIAIIGPNGAGKTTLVKAILGLVSSTGSISMFGIPFTNKNSHIRIGYVPQRIEFDRTFPLTVSELVGLTVPP